MGSKVPFGNFFNSGKMAMALLNMGMKFIFLLIIERHLLKHYESANSKNYPYVKHVLEGTPNLGFRSVRVENRDFQNSLQYGFF